MNFIRRHWIGILIVLGIVVYCVVGMIAYEARDVSTKPNWQSASCYKIPAKYHGGLYCSDELEGGNHGYVNPGSMEWEVE